ncbi:MAG: CheF family chemotaxis protein [Haloarculaceae archaeon]
MRDWPGPDAALDPGAFRRLYRGALALDGERRLGAATAVLLTGRLGLHPTEVTHLHEGWLDWERGVIVVPAKDPCACTDCWDRARAMRDYDEPVLDVLYERCWTPTARAERSVAFGWSPRIAAALEALFDRQAVLDVPVERIEDLLAAAAANAPNLAADDATGPAMGATAAAFLGDLGLDPATVAGLLGVERERVAPFCEVGGAVRALYRHAGAAERSPTLAAPTERFPLACGTQPVGGEPFDPADGDLSARRERADGPDPETNPRTVDVADAVDYDSDDHASAGVPERVETNAGAAGGDANADPSGAAASTVPDGASAANGSGQSPDGATGERAATDGATGPPAADEGAGAEEIAGDAGGAPTVGGTPREAVTTPIIADVTAPMAADGVTDGPFEGRLVLGQEELLVAAATDRGADLDDAAHRLIPLDTVADLALDYVPKGMADTFETTIAIAYRPDGGERRVVIAELSPSRRRDLASALYRILLNVTPVTVRHPARVAGRVMDTDAEPMVMYVRPRRVEFTDRAGESVECAVSLDDIIHVERGRRSVDDDLEPVVEIRHVSGNRPTTTTVGTEQERILELFGRYVRREYRQSLREVRAVSLSDPEKMLLVALYSVEDDRGLGDVINLDPETLSATLDSLSTDGLVRDHDDGVVLTGKGQLAVSDRLDSVNE